MHIDGINEIEVANDIMDYDRVKLKIVFDNDDECRQVWKAIKDNNKEVEESYWGQFDAIKDLELIAFLHYNHKDKTVTVEQDLLSAYFDGEWEFPNKWLKPHALERCIEYVADLYKEKSLPEIYKEHGLFSSDGVKEYNRVMQLYYTDKVAG